MGTSFDANLVEPGDVLFDKYRVDRVVGRGGMGVVFAAHHVLLDRPVAVKVLVEEQRPEIRSRFLNEARIMARITGAHVCRVHDVGVTGDGTSYIVMDLLEGADLDAHVSALGRPLAVAEAVDFVLQALEPIAQAHACGIVHRDLKPSNLFVTRSRDPRATIKVLDFGISKMSPSTLPKKASFATKPGALMGSPSYMAPEQICEASDVDARADIWSIGVVLYDLFTGELPFSGRNFCEVMTAVLRSDPVPVDARRADVPPALAQIVGRCLRRDPALRFPDVVSLAKELAPFTPAGDAHLVAIRRAARDFTTALAADAPRPPQASAPAVVAPVVAAAPPRTFARSIDWVLVGAAAVGVLVGVGAVGCFAGATREHAQQAVRKAAPAAFVPPLPLASAAPPPLPETSASAPPAPPPKTPSAPKRTKRPARPRRTEDILNRRH